MMAESTMPPDKLPPNNMPPDKIRFVALYSVVAMVVVFLVNYAVLKTDVQTAAMWATGLGAIVFAMVWRRVKG
jgi:hypothetical protein